MRKKITKEFFEALTEVALEAKGYEVQMDGEGYIRAYTNDIETPDLLIYSVGRCLSNKKAKETTMISANERAVEKLEKRTSEIAGNFIPCIAFGVGKYGYTDSRCVLFLLLFGIINLKEVLFFLFQKENIITIMKK